jgi:hypothetical protein
MNGKSCPAQDMRGFKQVFSQSGNTTENLTGKSSSGAACF